ncbi:hypothetical protein EN802_13585 [bacterium M00.F.Ca.ET.159.01.1.1]|nr:hypothetical protein EN802_13585 [bacterium M00.F.Ca.ET.159.01.1.1]
MEPIEGFALDAVPPRKGVIGDEGDRKLAATIEILAIELKDAPGAPVELVPGFLSRIIRPAGDFLGDNLVRILLAEFGEPVGMAFPLQVEAEGRG